LNYLEVLPLKLDDSLDLGLQFAVALLLELIVFILEGLDLDLDLVKATLVLLGLLLALANEKSFLQVIHWDYNIRSIIIISNYEGKPQGSHP
jgi:hypothetical protein